MATNINKFKKDKVNNIKQQLVENLEKQDVKDYLLMIRDQDGIYKIYCNSQTMVSLYELKGVLECYLVQNQIDMIELIAED